MASTPQTHPATPFWDACVEYNMAIHAVRRCSTKAAANFYLGVAQRLAQEMLRLASSDDEREIAECRVAFCGFTFL